MPDLCQDQKGPVVAESRYGSRKPTLRITSAFSSMTSIISLDQCTQVSRRAYGCFKAN